MMTFDIDKLTEALEKARKEDTYYNGGDFTPATFLPEGNHKLRFFVDPEGELIRKVLLHGSMKDNTFCPNILRQEGEEDIPEDLPKECEICKECEHIKGWKDNPKLSQRNMVYAYLHSTDSKSDYWVPGNWYAVISRGPRLRNALLSFVDNMIKDAAEYVLAMLDPQKEGWMVSVEVVRGTQGRVSMSFVPGRTVGPIELNDTYRPLREVYYTEFNKTAYDNLLEKARSLRKSEEEKSEEKNNETPWDENTVLLSTGKTITLPDDVVERNCWKKYDSSQPVCVTCPINMECMFELSK